jgi:raffinose/stachyose/melibiose transport system permease protein
MKNHRFWHLALFLGPALLVYGFFSAWPLLDTLRLSFFAHGEQGGQTFAGWSHYRTILFDPVESERFWNAMRNNLEFFAIHMLVQNPVALLLAAMLSLRGLKGSSVYRTVFFLPTLLSVVMVGFVWQLLLSPIWGLSEGFLALLGLQDWFEPWLGQEETALITLSLISVWQFVGIPMMLIYAALIAIPDDIIEAAVVDGASTLRIFLTIRLPLIWPTLGLVSVLTFIGNFNAFDLIYAVKGALAGPNYSTDILGTLFYRTFFGYQSQLPNPSQGAALASLMLLFILIGLGAYFVLVQRRLQRFTL